MRGRRRTLWSALSVTVIAAVIATMAVLYQGFTTADVELNDGGVWVTEAQDSLVGHLNYPSRLLDGSFQDRSPTISLYQDGNDVLSFDQAAGALTLIDPAKLIAGGVASLTSGSRVGLRGGVLGIIDAGKNGLYVVGSDSVSGFSVTGRDPLAQLGAGSAVGVGVDGTVHAVSVEKSQVVSVAGTSAAPVIRSLAKFGDKASVSITAVGDVPVVLDSANGVLYVGDKVIQAPGAKGGVLQYPGAASGNVLVATTAGLLEQPLDGGAATLVPVSGGTPSEPVSLAGCAYAVWSGSAAYLRDCPGDSDDVSKTIPGAGSQPQLTLRQNRNVVVVNELREGRTWLVNEDLQLVDNWEQVAPEDEQGEDESDKEELQFTLPNRDHPNKPPKAEKDAYGVRAGQTTLLPVLENDSDPDGDLLVASLRGSAPADVTVQQVQAGAALQVTAGRNVSGTVTFTYQVDDGRTGTAEAQVTLSVAPADVNTAPRQESVRTMQLELGASGSYDATMKWTDPEGDNFYLKRAWSETGDRVTFRNNGMVQFTDSTGEIGVHEVKLLMSDGTDEAEGLLKINVRPEGAASPIANADRYTARVGEKVTVAPLANDLSVNGEELSLAKIDEQAGSQTALDQASGTFSFVANAPGTYYTQYLVTDGMKPAQGIVRVDVRSADASDDVPLASIDTALVPTSRDVLVDVLANDTDPAGGILVVQSVTVPGGSKVSAEVLEHRAIRVRDTGGLDAPLTISYRVSNGARWADGYIRVIPVSLPQKLRAPVTVDDRAVVRAGDIVTVDVLANDYHPDGDDLELQSQLSEMPDTVDGVAFVSEGKVRFKAGEKAKTVSLVYQVSDSQQNVNSAYLRIQIVAVDAQHNAAPIPQSVTARTIAGTSVRVPIPLSGTDPDGDSVELVGLASAPKKGRVSIGDSWLVYQAYPGTTGRDSFDYILRDRLGATSTGTVVVGVVAPSNLNQAPYTARDEVEIRPGRSVSVPVLQNDSDPDGDDLALVSNALRASSDVKAEVVKSRVLVHAPAAEGQYAITYVAVDTFGAKAQGSLVVKVAATAPLQAPVARDDRVPPSALGEAKPVPVNVLENDEDPDGVADDLTVTSDSPFAVAGTNGVLTVTPQPQPQVVLYSITDADQQSASAVVVVPGTDSMLPTLTSSTPVEIVAGKELSLALADYVTVRPGRTPRISEADSLRAAHASNDSLVKDEHTLTYTADADYFGPDAVAVMVTDGDGPDDPEGNNAYVAIPILVVPARNQPPTFLNTEVQVAPGEDAADLNWRKLSNDPDPGDLGRLSVEVTSKPAGISARAEGDHLLIAAESAAKPGSQGEVVVAVKDGTTPPTKGTVKVTVTTSQRPLPVAVDDVITRADQGTALSIDVLANDLPNPFPDTPLTLIDAALVSGDGTVKPDGSKVIVTPGADFHGTLLATYRVQDATRTADRQAEGKIRVTVQGRPDRPEKPVVVSEGNREVKLSWTPPPNNGRPILGYTVTSAVDNVSQKCPSTNCTIKGLRNNVKYTFAVVATNEVGDSDKSPNSAVARPDVRPNTPEPPEVVRTDRDKGGALDVKWKDPGGEGSKVQNYDLVLDQGPNKPKVTTTSLTWDGLTNGTWYRIKVRARNLAKDPSEWSQWSVKAKPFGIPDPPRQPDTRPATPVGSESQIAVSWPAVSGDATNGDDVKDYDLEVRRGGSVVDTLKGISATQKNVVVATSTTDYTFRVRARNGAGESDWSPASPPRRAANPPGAPSGLKVTPGDQKLTVDFSMADADLNGNKRSELTYFYKLNNSGGGRLTSGDVITGLTNGTKYTVTVWAESTVEGVTPGAKASDADNVPFGKPKIYLDGIDRLDNAVRFRWHVDSNGASLTSENPNLSGSSGEKTVSGLSPGQSTSITVTYANKAGSSSETWPGQANDPPPKTVSLSKGAGVAGTGPTTSGGNGCSVGTTCYHLHIVASNFAGSTQLRAECYAGGGWYFSQNVTTNGSGGWAGDLNCWSGYADTKARVGGVESNSANFR